MGCAASTEATGEPNEAPLRKQNSRDKSSTTPRKPEDDKVRVVLIGPGESGKSTVLKQMRLLEAKEKGKSTCWTDEELMNARAIVYSNAVGQMRLLVQLAFQFEAAWSNPDVSRAAKEFIDIPLDSLTPNDPALGRTMKRLWGEEALRVMYNERDHLYNLNDGAGYLWDSLERIYAADYVPTEADLLRVRLRTAQADEVEFNYRGSPITVTDVGGQKQERRKWADHIYSASTLLFVSSLCEWDQKMREEANKVRMTDTFEVFEEVCGELNDKQNMVVLLNKLDLFTEKIRAPKSRDHFKEYFTDYKGPLAAPQCSAHIKERFIAIGKRRKVRLHVHLITALEADSVRLLWHGIRETLVEEALNAVVF